MRPLEQLPDRDAARLEGLLFDLDDTLLDEGRLRVEALRALYELREAGLRLVGVTGRPATWGQVLVRQWPVDAMLTENGILGLRREAGRVVLLDRLAPEARAKRRAELLALAREMQHELPELRPSDDAAGRLADFSFDIAEAATLSEVAIERATAFARARGARVVRSSIQLHVSLDTDDKASGAVRLLWQLFGTDPTAARNKFAFVGDSGNDAPCFAAFECSIAVANLTGNPSLLPRYITASARSEGFREVARKLVEAKGRVPADTPSTRPAR